MECINPLFVRKTGIHVRCGKCLPCKQKIQKEWSARLAIELQNSVSAFFVTFTYNDLHIPRQTPDGENYRLYEIPELEKFNDPSVLDKNEIQLFLMRLRQVSLRGMPDYYKGKKVAKIPLKIENKAILFKYFIVGEYGTKSNRAHWHFLFFNLPYDSENLDLVLNHLWRTNGEPKGLIHIGEVKMNAIDYVTDYMLKNDKKDTERLISKGLGKVYLTDTKVQYHVKTLCTRIRANQQFHTLPSYLKKRIFTAEQRQSIADKILCERLDKQLSDPYLVERQYKQLQQKTEYKLNKKAK